MTVGFIFPPLNLEAECLGLYVANSRLNVQAAFLAHANFCSLAAILCRDGDYVSKKIPGFWP